MRWLRFIKMLLELIPTRERFDKFIERFFGYIFSAVGAYTAGYLGISLIKSLSMQKDYSGFGYYSCGVSLFSFILYLTVV